MVMVMVTSDKQLQDYFTFKACWNSLFRTIPFLISLIDGFNEETSREMPDMGVESPSNKTDTHALMHEAIMEQL